MHDDDRPLHGGIEEQHAGCRRPRHPAPVRSLSVDENAIGRGQSDSRAV